MKKWKILSTVLAISFVWALSRAAIATVPVADDLVRHYDASAIEGLNNGDTVSAWPDLSGNYEATAQGSPSYYCDSNSVPPSPAVVRFDGSVDVPEFFYVGDLSALSAGQVFIVFKRTLRPDVPWMEWDYSGLWRLGTSGLACHIPAPGAPPSTIYDGFGSSVRWATSISGNPAFLEGVVYSAASSTDGWKNVLNGVELYFDSIDTVSFSPDALLGTSQPGTHTVFYGDIAEFLLYDRVLTEEEENAVGTYLSQKYDIITTYQSTWINALIPDDFEDYTDDPNFLKVWSSTGTLSLENSEVNSGVQSMKSVLTASSGIITKDKGESFNYSSQDNKDVIIWFKGDSSNAVGDVTLSVLDDSGRVMTTGTFTDGTVQIEWTPLRAAIEVNPANPNSWTKARHVQIDIGAAGTVYFDDLDFVIPPAPLEKIVEWRFDESEGKTAYDSSGNDINGTLSKTFIDLDWVIDGGHTGESGDNALRFMSNPDDPNYVVLAENVTLPEGISDIFAGGSSWSINQWIYLIEQPSSEPDAPQGVTAGGFGAFSGESGAVYRMFTNFGSNPVNIGLGGGTAETNMSTSSPLDLGEWNMVTFTYDKWTGRLSIYKDAILIASQVVSFDDAPHQIYVGIRDNEANTAPNALIDDFNIWNQALSSEEVLILWGNWLCDERNRPELDYDSNCQVDIGDLAYFALKWLDCGRLPRSFCTQ